MKVELKRIDQDFHFESVGSTAVPVHIDAATKIGGHDAGTRPMELLLMGVGGCSAIDVILILKKQKQALEDIKIIVEGHRQKGATLSVFTDINLHFVLSGKLDKKKVDRAISLSMNKYCSASAMLGKTAKMSYSFEIR
jgi:putative redox protein